MAAPNIINVASIVPHTNSLTPANTARQGLVAAPATGEAHKINQIIATNIEGTNAADVTVELRLADGTTFRSIANTISVPADASLIVLDKTTSLYLLDTSVTGEPSMLWVTSGTANSITFTCSYETIS